MIGTKLTVQRPVVRSAVLAKPVSVRRRPVTSLAAKEPFGGSINGQQVKPNDGAQEVPNPTLPGAPGREPPSPGKEAYEPLTTTGSVGDAEAASRPVNTEESPEEVERRALSYVAEKKDRDAQEASKTRAAEEAEAVEKFKAEAEKNTHQSAQSTPSQSA